MQRAFKNVPVASMTTTAWKIIDKKHSSRRTSSAAITRIIVKVRPTQSKVPNGPDSTLEFGIPTVRNM
jgi:hypothetical protein